MVPNVFTTSFPIWALLDAHTDSDNYAVLSAHVVDLQAAVVGQAALQLSWSLVHRWTNVEFVRELKNKLISVDLWWSFDTAVVNKNEANRTPRTGRDFLDIVPQLCLLLYYWDLLLNVMLFNTNEHCQKASFVSNLESLRDVLRHPMHRRFLCHNWVNCWGGQHYWIVATSKADECCFYEWTNSRRPNKCCIRANALNTRNLGVVLNECSNKHRSGTVFHKGDNEKPPRKWMLNCDLETLHALAFLPTSGDSKRP